jgi:hypothetical protein
VIRLSEGDDKITSFWNANKENAIPVCRRRKLL